MIKIRLCGVGYRRRNLFRTLSSNPGIRLVADAKPMCTTSAEADDMTARAGVSGPTLMAYHSFLFHPAVLKLGRLVRSGDDKPRKMALDFQELPA